MRLEFLKCQMDNESMAKYIYSLAKGITLIQLNMEDLRKIRFITPPLAMQDKYILFVRQLDKSKFVAQKTTQLLQSML